MRVGRRWSLGESQSLTVWHLLCAVLLVVAAGSEAEIRSRYQERAQRAVLALLQVISAKVQKLQALAKGFQRFLMNISEVIIYFSSKHCIFPHISVWGACS